MNRYPAASSTALAPFRAAFTPGSTYVVAASGTPPATLFVRFPEPCRNRYVTGLGSHRQREQAENRPGQQAGQHEAQSTKHGFTVKQYVLFGVKDPLSITPGEGEVDAVIVGTPREMLRYRSYLASFQNEPLSRKAADKIASELDGPIHFTVFAHAPSGKPKDQDFLKQFSNFRFTTAGGKALQPASRTTFGPARDFFNVAGKERVAAIPEETFQAFVGNVGPFKAQLRAGFPRFGEEDARSIPVPTLLVSGAETPAPLTAVTDRLEELLPDVSRLNIAGAGHNMFNTHPTEFNAGVMEFIGRH